MKERLQAQGDRELAKRILGNYVLRKAIDHFEKQAGDLGARRHLLGTALRLSKEMAPDVQETMDACRDALEITLPVETYVVPSPVFNAAAVRPERGMLFVILSSSLLEAFETDELRFVVGHELGHHLFEHYRIPVGALLGGGTPLTPGQALELFAWQRFAEISSDRAGVVCGGGLDSAARALFKLASGMRGGRIEIHIDQFLAQVTDLEEEAGRLARGDETPRTDWFATHPFSPIRLRAAELFAGSDLMVDGGLPRDALEAQVQQLMSIMSASYLQERSDIAEAMRRLLFAGAVALASMGEGISKPALAALEELLGPGSIPSQLNAERIVADLPRRIEAVRETVPALRRAQVIRDLCVIASADGAMTGDQRDKVEEIARGIEVDPHLVRSTADTQARAH